MSLPRRIAINSKSFLIDYCQRHAHPVNALLHIFGVPMAFYGLAKLLTGKPFSGLSLLTIGYLFQYLGHRAQGNEVGEVTLVKKIWSKIQGTSATKTGYTHTESGGDGIV